MAVTSKRTLAATTAGCLAIAARSLFAGVLPEDRADALYHSYDGGGVEISGPSVLVRKSLGKTTSISGNYYVDSITSASIDVVTTSSGYTEEREEKSVGIDHLHDKTNMSAGYTESDENDFVARSASFSYSQDIFGDLTTVSMGYSRGWDTVKKRGDANFAEDVKRQHYRLGVSQILTKNTLADLAMETITDEGYLNNPYRQVRYVDPDNANSYLRQSENYPRTRTSNAVALRALHYLPWRASIKGEGRLFKDTWGIDASTLEVGYTHPWGNDWIFEGGFRLYSQSGADFYKDLFSRENETNFRARDKELSPFTSQTIMLGTSYTLSKANWSIIDRGSINFNYMHIQFNYDDFRDLRSTGVSPGSEPVYSFSANVIEVFVSVWY